MSLSPSAVRSFPYLDDERDIRLAILTERVGTQMSTGSTSLIRLNSVDAENLPDPTNSPVADSSMCFIITLAVIQKLHFLSVNI